MDAQVKQAVVDHLGENSSAKSVLFKLGATIALSVLAALAPVLIDFLPQLPHLLANYIPEGIYRVIEPSLLIVINLLIAWLATLARKDAKKAVTQALATPVPEALEKFYEQAKPAR